jgi:hypothetical protein
MPLSGLQDIFCIEKYFTSVGRGNVFRFDEDGVHPDEKKYAAHD